jgi:hypothetical protein
MILAVLDDEGTSAHGTGTVTDMVIKKFGKAFASHWTYRTNKQAQSFRIRRELLEMKKAGYVRELPGERSYWFRTKAGARKLKNEVVEYVGNPV